VQQQLNIFSGTVAENIATGDEEPDMRRMEGICSKLGILGFIEQLPDGFGTRLGEKGVSLSGGQKQRIAIARSLYRSPRILILDEAMSNLDAESEAIVQKVLHDLRDRGLTVLMITHRLSSLAGADKIVVLDKGRVVEQGTHQDLYNRAGKYYRLWQKQIPAFFNCVMGFNN
jgi:ATP-binding cassette subfamily B protein